MTKPDQTKTTAERYKKLQALLKTYRKVLVAYSGGVDSVFLLKTALDCLGRDKVVACIGVSASLARREYRAAQELAESLGATLEVVHPREMDNPRYQANPADRCYHCKTELFSLLLDVARQRGLDAVLAGSNADDVLDYRPGLKAEEELSIKSPLRQAGLTKEDIRTLSKTLGLPTWNKPSQPCLASRMSYGLEITPERLRQIEQGEDFLRGLGLPQLRVRHHDSLVRIEVPPERLAELVRPEIRDRIVAFFKELGFKYVSLDLQGFRSGSANEVLPSS